MSPQIFFIKNLLHCNAPPNMYLYDQMIKSTFFRNRYSSPSFFNDNMNKLFTSYRIDPITITKSPKKLLIRSNVKLKHTMRRRKHIKFYIKNFCNKMHILINKNYNITIYFFINKVSEIFYFLIFISSDY